MLATVAGLTLTLLGSAPPRGPRRAPDDATIIARFQEMVSVDNACAQLAVEKAHSKEVRDFAALLLREHGMAMQMARDAALQASVKIKPREDNQLRAEHDNLVKSLRDRPDNAFDILFMRHEVDYHKALAALIANDLIPAAQNPDLSGMLSQVAPAFAAHGKMADDIFQRLSKK
jgi:putative membrane protein